MLRKTAAHSSSLQQLRGVAALMVLLFHDGLTMENLRKTSTFAHIFDVRFGVYGVCFFFALSGYLMAGAIRRQDSSHFLAARALRIYPMFLLTVGLTAILYALFSIPFAAHPLGYLLMPYTPRTMESLGVEWTLVFEMTFYVTLFMIAAAGLRSLIPALAALWTVAIVITGVAWWPLQEWATGWPIHEMFLVLPSLSFAGGLLAAYVKRAPPIGVAVAACIVAMAIYGYHDPMTNTSRYLASVCAVILVASLGARDRAAPSTHIGRYLTAAAEKLGDWSYALYLCHVPLCIAIYLLLPAYVPDPVAFLLVLAIAISAAALLGTVDLKLYEKARNALQTAPPASVMALSGLYFVTFLGFSIVTAYNRKLNQMEIADAGKVASALLPIKRDDAALTGAIDLLQFKGQALTAEGWAFDRASPQRPVFVALAVNGNVAAVVQTTIERPDVSKAHDLDRAFPPSGFSMTTGLCAPDVAVFAFTMDRRARVLPHADSVACSGVAVADKIAP